MGRKPRHQEFFANRSSRKYSERLHYEHSERMLSEFFNGSDVGLAIIDEQLRYRMLNPYLAASHHAPIETHLGKHLREILGDVAAQVEPAIEKVFGAPIPILNCEVAGALPTRPDETRWISSFFPVMDTNGNVKNVGAVVVEVGRTVELQAPENPLPSGVMRSWKELAHYVGTCVKTVQRWEQMYQFPVRRVNPSKGSVVFAFQNEVEEWLHNRTFYPEAPNKRKR